MRKLNNLTRVVILVAICVLSIAAISFSWLSRPQTDYINSEENFGKLMLSTKEGAVGTETGDATLKAYTRMSDRDKNAVTATTYLAVINPETGKYETDTTPLSDTDTVSVAANSCTYFVTELNNTNANLPTRVSLLVPEFSGADVSIFSFAPYKDKADDYIVRNIEVVSGTPVYVKWYFTNSGSAKVDIQLSKLPSVEYFK